MELRTFLHAEILICDGSATLSSLRQSTSFDPTLLICIRNALTFLSCVKEFNEANAIAFKDNPELTEVRRNLAKSLEFAEYIRDKAIAHQDPRVLDKIIEWKPFVAAFPGMRKRGSMGFLMTLWLIEVAINSYVDPDGSHRYFTSETSLEYRPDVVRFLGFVDETLVLSINLLEGLLIAHAEQLPVVDMGSRDMLLKSIDAGLTRFEKLKGLPKRESK
jgi:hypothetical protein